MAKLSAFTDSEQLSLDDVLAEFRDASPPKRHPDVEIGPDPELQGDVSQTKIGTELHNGTCPYTQRCEERRRQLSTYRPFQLCHWRAWGDWRRCPIYRNGGNGR